MRRSFSSLRALPMLLAVLLLMVPEAGTASATSTHSAASRHASQGTAATRGNPHQAQPLSTADRNPGGANGKCSGGPYCSTRNGTSSLNGNGKGIALGKPCAGCVGKADNKNPPGQYPNGSDPNAGYECDTNHGIGRSNPAHTGCTVAATSTSPTPTATPTTASGKPPSAGSPGRSAGHGSPTTKQSPAGGRHPANGVSPATVKASTGAHHPGGGSTPAEAGTGSTAGQPPVVQVTPRSLTGLPFTDLDVGLVVLLGLVLLAGGLIQRRLMHN